MAGSVASQLAVGDGVRSGGVGAQPLDLVLLVGLEVAFVPVPLGRVGVVALPREDVGGDPVQEPPVVADHHGTAGKLQQGVLQRTQGLYVQVVGGLVQQQQVATL